MKVIDLTHTIKEGMPVFPGTEPPKLDAASTFERTDLEKLYLLCIHIPELIWMLQLTFSKMELL